MTYTGYLTLANGVGEKEISYKVGVCTFKVGVCFGDILHTTYYFYYDYDYDTLQEPWSYPLRYFYWSYPLRVSLLHSI